MCLRGTNLLLFQNRVYVAQWEVPEMIADFAITSKRYWFYFLEKLDDSKLHVINY